jgi:hypothetical protein
MSGDRHRRYELTASIGMGWRSRSTALVAVIMPEELEVKSSFQRKGSMFMDLRRSTA